MGTVGFVWELSWEQDRAGVAGVPLPWRGLGGGETSQLVVGLRSPRRIPMPAWKDYQGEMHGFSARPFASLQRGSNAADAPEQDLPRKGAVPKPGNS